MRVRPKRSLITRRLDRSVHPVERTPEVIEPPVEVEAHPMQRYWALSIGPPDCGMVFHAAVSTTVPCPHCGISQAW